MPLYVATMCEGPGELIVGELLGRRIHITDLNGVPTDTGSVTFDVRQPDASTYSAAISHLGVGEYLATLNVFLLHGIYRWRAVAAGLVNDAQQGSFRVLRAVL